MKAVGVIPARWASTRFPGKSLTVLCGKPLIQWVFERAGMAGRLDLLMVATDDERIRTAVEAFGGKAVMTRKDHASGTDRVAEAIKGVSAEIVVNIQGDEPLIDPVLIDRLVEVMMSEPAWDMATAAAPIDNEAELRDSSVVKIVCGRKERALFFSRSVIPFDRDRRYNCDRSLYKRHLGIYAYRRDFLDKFVASSPCLIEEVERLEQLRALYLDARIKVLQADSGGVGVDTPEDVSRAEKAIRGMVNGVSHVGAWQRHSRG